MKTISIAKLKGYYTRTKTNVEAVPYLSVLMSMEAYCFPREGTWEELWVSLISGGLCIVFVTAGATLYLASIWKERWIEYPVQPLPEGVGIGQYAVSIFYCAITLAFLTAIFGGLGLQTVGKLIEWPAFIAVNLLRNIILAVPITLWGWKVLSKLPDRTSLIDPRLTDPFHSP